MTPELQTPYKPISCDFSDELEALSVKKKKVRLKVRDEDGSSEWIQGTILDIFTKDHAEYLKLNDQIIRLDQILDWTKS